MILDSKKLKLCKTFGDELGLTRQRIFQLAKEGKIDSIVIDKIRFVIESKKTLNFKKEYFKK